jgi:2-polyprenyl-6-methoxyphenol hydroxylase-like FAD-dependent oxidoreductase
MRKPTLLVSGAGIAGTTLAVLAARAGFDVTVVERAAGQRSSGSPVDVHGIAFDIAERLGIAEELAAHATSTKELEFVDAAGTPVAHMPINSALDPRHIEISRTDLSAAIAGAGKDDYAISWSDQLTAVEQTGEVVRVDFANSESGEFDLVVGADGLHSGVRALAFGPEDDFVRFRNLYVATVQLSETVADLSRVVMHNSPGASVTVHPVTGHPGAAFIFRSHLRVSYRDPSAALDLIRTTYRDVGWRAQEFIETYAAADETYFDAVSQVRMPAWSIGSIGLVGDAASSLSLFGDGSSSAMIGAATLARELAAARDSDRDWTAAFARYEKNHRRVIAPNLRGFEVAARLLVPRTRSGILVRNAAVRVAGVARHSRPSG